MSEPIQLRLHTPVRPQQKNGERNMWEMVSDLREGELHIPYHQREFVWPPDKQAGWIERLLSDVWPVGVIVTYQVYPGSDRRVYVNDGNQRLGTLLRAVLDPDQYGLTLDHLKALLRAVQMPVQHRVYQSHAQAFEDYQGLNWGTPMTPYQFHKGAITTLPDYDVVWLPLIDAIHGVMKSVESSIVSERRSRNSKQVSSVARDDLATFYRFISRSVGRDDLRIARAGKRKEPVFEWDLRRQMETLGPEGLRAQIARYEKVVEQETALIRYAWHTVLGKPNESGINLVTYRWLICAAVWRRNAGILVPVWKEFMVGALRESAGRGRFDQVDENGVTQIRAWLAYNDLTKLDDVCKYIGSDMVTRTLSKRPRRDVTTRRGNDDSHRLPFSTNGDGETFPEPASLNRSRGARPVEAGG